MMNVLEVAELLYKAGKDDTPQKMPESVRELAPHTQRRFRTYAEAVLKAVAEGRFADGGDDGLGRDTTLTRDLAEHLAWKLNNPQQFSDGVRMVLNRYALEVGEENLSDEVKQAMQI